MQSCFSLTYIQGTAGPVRLRSVGSESWIDRRGVVASRGGTGGVLLELSNPL